MYDTHGNVWEWCQDWYGEYAGGIALDPQGPLTGSDRVFRGGVWFDWFSDAGYCRSAHRWGYSPAYRGGIIGFRVVLAPDQP